MRFRMRALLPLGAWTDEIPRNPAAWLTTTARRKAVDRIRRTRNLQRKYEVIAREADGISDESLDEDVIGDDRLRLIFTCCHPSLAQPARIALTLKTVGGLNAATPMQPLQHTRLRSS